MKKEKIKMKEVIETVVNYDDFKVTFNALEGQVEKVKRIKQNLMDGVEVTENLLDEIELMKEMLTAHNLELRQAQFTLVLAHTNPMRRLLEVAYHKQYAITEKIQDNSIIEMNLVEKYPMVDIVEFMEFCQEIEVELDNKNFLEYVKGFSKNILPIRLEAELTKKENLLDEYDGLSVIYRDNLGRAVKTPSNADIKKYIEHLLKALGVLEESDHIKSVDARFLILNSFKTKNVKAKQQIVLPKAQTVINLLTRVAIRVINNDTYEVTMQGLKQGETIKIETEESK